jgi:hypothetical protein
MLPDICPVEVKLEAKNAMEHWFHSSFDGSLNCVFLTQTAVNGAGFPALVPFRLDHRPSAAGFYRADFRCHVLARSPQYEDDATSSL